ncbi:MAG: Crp/Fnr family transcriptional regulator [Oligoflexales bacterium]
MPGKNFAVQKGQLLFKEGDKSDGMFLLRAGELLVFLEKDGEEIQLAKIAPGGMIGEMALFDSQPRSASVKASQRSDVTHITQADFNKLMKQIPKWFTSLMGTLSNRLRTTNHRVQELTEKIEELQISNSPEILALKRSFVILKLANEVWQLKGEKVGKSSRGYQHFVIDKAAVTNHISQKMQFNPKELSLIMRGLEKAKIAFEKGAKLCAEHKSNVGRFTTFLGCYLDRLKYPSIPIEVKAILLEIHHLSNEVAYDPFSVTTQSLKEAASKHLRPNVAEWDKYFSYLQIFDDELRLVKVENGAGFKVHKKNINDAQFFVNGITELVKSVLGT